MIPKVEIINALETRYDYQTARTVFKEAMARAGVGDKDGYSPQDLSALADVLRSHDPKRSDRVTGVMARIAALTGGGNGAARAAEPAPEVIEAPPAPPAAEPAPAEPAPVEAAPAADAPSEAAPAAEGDADAPADGEGKKKKKK